MSQVFPHHFLIIKLIYKVFGFIIKICWGKTWDMHKRAFQGLKRTFMHVSGLLSAYFDLKNQKLYKLVFLSKYAGRRPETCINVRFRAWNARLCMSQVFPQHILIRKLKFIKFLVLLSKYGGGRPETCVNVRFRPWNARLSMSQVFPQHILIMKPKTL